MKNQTILIVEDDSVSAAQMVRILSKFGYAVLPPISTGEHAIAAIRSNPSKLPDLVLMDIQLEGEMDGIHAAEQIREITNVPIVFMSGHSHHSIIERAKMVGPYGYLLKPVSSKELIATVETVLHKHRIDLAVQNEKRSLETNIDTLKQQIEHYGKGIVLANRLLQEEIEDRKLRERILETALQLSRYAEQHSIDDLIQKAIDEIELLTESELGFFLFVSENEPSASNPVLSSSTKKHSCKLPFQHILPATTKGGILSEPMLKARPMIYNQFALVNLNLPEGHAELKRLLTVPVITDGTINAIVALANKKNSYKQLDITTVSTLAHLACDLVQKKQMEEALVETEKTFRLILDGISDPILLLDANGGIQRMNQAAYRYFGIEQDTEIRGIRCYEVRKCSEPCEGCHLPFDFIENFQGHYERRSLHHQDRIERIYIDHVQDDQGRLLASIVRITDITEIRKTERHLLQSEKLASLGILVAGVAHEINNPNTFILFNIPILHRYFDALLSIVDESVKDPTDLQILNKPYESFRNDCLKTLDNIENGSRRINQIVSNLREYVRERDKGKVKAIQIKPFIEQILSLCIGRIRKSVRTFEVNIAEDLPPFVTDSLALEQILINLLINAAQASDKEDSWVKLSVFMLRTAQPKLVIQVQDNGCGMDVETQKKIFQPFFTTKEIGEGTGIGLAIVDKLVMELKGQIEVESVKGQGSVFRLIFNVDPKTLEPSALEPKVG